MSNQYSKVFVDKVKSVYGENSDLAQRVEQNQYFAGRILNDSSMGGISVNEVLLATSLDVLQKKARDLKIKKELYSDWCDETRDWT